MGRQSTECWQLYDKHKNNVLLIFFLNCVSVAVASVIQRAPPYLFNFFGGPIRIPEWPPPPAAERPPIVQDHFAVSDHPNPSAICSREAKARRDLDCASLAFPLARTNRPFCSRARSSSSPVQQRESRAADAAKAATTAATLLSWPRRGSGRSKSATTVILHRRYESSTVRSFCCFDPSFCTTCNQESN
jgi:hypothetical protein